MKDDDLLGCKAVRTDDDNGIDFCFKTGLDRGIDQVPSRWIYGLLNRPYPTPAKLLSYRNQSRRQSSRCYDQDLRIHRLCRLGKIQPAEEPVHTESKPG